MGWKSTSIVESFKQLSGVELETKEARELSKQFTLMMFSTIDANQFKKYLKKYISEASLRTDYSTLLTEDKVFWGIKVWLYWCAKNGMTGADCEAIAPQFNVGDNDSGLWRILDDAEVNATMQALIDEGFDARMIRDIDDEIDGICKAYQPWARNHVAKKQYFIYSNPHSGRNKDGIVTDCYLSGVKAVRRAYPRMKTERQSINMLKKSFKFQGNTIISKNVSAKAAVLLDDGKDGFLSSIVKFPESDTERFNSDDGSHSNSEASVTISQIIDGLDGHQRTAAKCLLGEKDEDFTEWLAANARPNHRIRNDDLCMEISASAYRKYVVKYMGDIGLAEPNKCVNQLRDTLRRSISL